MGERLPDFTVDCVDGSVFTLSEQRGKVVGEEAANILIGQVEGFLPADKAEKRIVRTRLIVRGTTR